MSDIGNIVFENLDSALEGGQFGASGPLEGLSAEEIADDMTLYAVDCEGMDAADLVPHVKEWLARRG